MDIALINSRLDPAGRNIRSHLRDILGCGEEPAAFHGGRRYRFFETDGRLIHAAGADREVPADLVIFISRHTSTHPFPALTVHVTGNYGDAALGGEPETLVPAAPAWMRAILRELAARAPAGYRVSYEVTHHGPTDLSVPSLFVEIGSTEAEWTDPAAGRAVAESILAAEPSATLNLIGFGGTHYAARQTAIALATGAAFGHIAHTREAGTLDAAMVAEMRRQSGAVAAYIDRKSLAAPVLRRLDSLLDEAAIPRLSEGEIHGVDALGWERYRACTGLAEAAAPGARLHLPAAADGGEPAVLRLDGALLAEALKIDRERVVSGIEAQNLVSLTSPAGDLLPVFLTTAPDRSAKIHDLITLCVKIIISDEHAAADGDSLIIRRTRLDPDKARKLGVPKGPLFGRLAAGCAVEVDGSVVTPSMVATCSEKKIHVPGLERYT